MGVHLTPRILEHGYELLRAAPPFERWGLPPADQVVFRVMGTDDYMGLWVFDGGHHQISLSARRISLVDTMLSVMAHEMLHAYQHLTRTDSPRVQHNAAFRKMAAKICALHGWDEKAFI